MKWSTVDEFGIISVGSMDRVGFRYSAAQMAQSKPPVQGQGPSAWKIELAARNREQIGWDGILPNNFGMRADQLVELLNQLRNRCAAETS